MGDNSLLTEEFTLQIRKLVLQGKKYVEIQALLDISENTWDTWVYRDTQGFRVKLNDWKKERMTKQAEEFSDDLFTIPHRDTNGRVHVEIAKLKQKESEFLRERLNKIDYSSRTDLTTNGKDFVFVPNEVLDRITPVQEDETAS